MIKFKHNKDKTLFCCLHPVLLMIYSDLHWYAYQKHKVNLTVTETISTLEQDKKLNRVSSAHRDKIAIDIRTKDLTHKQIEDLRDYINNKWSYKDYRYQARSGVRRLAYYHDSGHGSHFHLAIHKKFALK